MLLLSHHVVDSISKSYNPSNITIYVAQWGVQKFVTGGAQNLKSFFVFCFSIFQGGAAQKIAEKMTFPTKKVAKYR